MAKETDGQKEIVGRVMHEFKHGELKTAGGRRVRNPKQAIAIGLSEAGASKQESAATNKRRRARTERRERAGATARGRAEGGETRASLYAEARRRGLRGLSHATKAELEAALRH